MKCIQMLLVFLLTVATGMAQQVFVNPTSVTLTKQGVVTIMVTDYKGSSSGGSYATIGTLTATYTNAVSGYASNQGYNYITASSANTGTVNAGTYTITTYNTPQQVTVILWGESAAQGFKLQDIALAYSSATAIDQAAFQAFITTLVQQQLTSLQSQITTQQGQITALQQSGSQQQADITALQQTVATLQTQYTQLAADLTALQSRLTALETQVAGISVTNGTNGSSGNNGNNGRNANNTLTYVGIGLGAAGVIGGVVNFFTHDKERDEAPATETVITEGSDK